MILELSNTFATFLSDTVNLPQARLDRLQTNVDSIFDQLRGVRGFRSTIVGTYAKQGSWAHQTIIKPKPNKEYDADIVLKLKYEDGKEPKEYLSDLRRAFGSTRYAAQVERKNRCVRVSYANDSHVDVVPAIVRPDGKLYIVVFDKNDWERTDPVAFAGWMRRKDDLANGNLRRVIRLTKYLRDHRGRFEGTKSVILTALLGEQVDEQLTITNPLAYGSIAKALVTIIGRLDGYLQSNTTMPIVQDPSVKETDFTHRWNEESYQHFRTRIHDLYPEMQTALAEPDPSRSEGLWRDIFGDRFRATSTTPATSSLLIPAAVGTSMGRSGRAG